MFCGFAKAQSPQQVTLLADDSYPPYSFVKNGQLKGIYVELIKAAAQALKPYYEVKLAAIPWKRGLFKLENGMALALFPPYKHFEERPFMWPYSVALLSETVVAFCQSDVDLSYHLNKKNNAVIAPLNIGINAGYYILNKALIAAKQKGTINVWENKDTRSNVLKLLSKRVDCYLNDRISTLWELNQLKQEFKNEHISFDDINEALIVMTQTSHIGYTNSENHKFVFKEDFIKRMDEALTHLQSTDKYQKILAKYLSTP